MFILINEFSPNTSECKKNIVLVMKEDRKFSYQQWFSSHESNANKFMFTFSIFVWDNNSPQS